MHRPKSFIRLFLRGWGWAAVIALIPTLVFVPMWYFSGRTAERLESEGVAAVATVTNKRVSRSDDSDSYYVYYRFVSEGGVTVQDRQSTSRGFYRSVQVGREIPVRYWRGDPEVSEVEEGTAASLRTVGMIGGLISLAVFLFCGRKAWRTASRARRLVEQGITRRVTVAGHRQTNVEINDVPQWTATWVEADGTKGETRMADRRKLPEEGTEITIYIDPDRQLASVWEGDVTERA